MSPEVPGWASMHVTKLMSSRMHGVTTAEEETSKNQRWKNLESMRGDKPPAAVAQVSTITTGPEEGAKVSQHMIK